MFEVGVKAGYERGFDNDGGKKGVISPYLQWNISPKFAIMTQPAFKYGVLDQRRIGISKSYYKENSDSLAVQNGPSTLASVTPDGTTQYVTFYKYSQSHDSIVKSSTYGGTYAEVEIPLLLKFKISKNFSVYGGVNLIYSKSIKIKENTASYKNIVITDSNYFVVKPYINPAPDPTSSVITYNGNDISSYKGPDYPTTTTDMWRVGYMLGFSYQYNKRWLFDGLVQQANTKSNYQAGYNINSALSVPYFRFTLGYKLK